MGRPFMGQGLGAAEETLLDWAFAQHSQSRELPRLLQTGSLVCNPGCQLFIVALRLVLVGRPQLPSFLMNVDSEQRKELLHPGHREAKSALSG